MKNKIEGGLGGKLVFPLNREGGCGRDKVSPAMAGGHPPESAEYSNG
jgi:hypothetical protein